MKCYMCNQEEVPNSDMYAYLKSEEDEVRHVCKRCYYSLPETRGTQNYYAEIGRWFAQQIGEFCGATFDDGTVFPDELVRENGLYTFRLGNATTIRDEDLLMCILARENE